MTNDRGWTTWRKLLACELAEKGETSDDIIAITLSDAELDKLVFAGFGGDAADVVFYAWSKDHVYFVEEYDSAAKASSVPRNPLEKVGTKNA